MLLSICIPTFNRAHTLRTLLMRLKNEIFECGCNNLIEIIVCDNCSEDDTEVIVREFQSNEFIIKYYKQSSNVGFGANLTKAFSIADGEYCWMMGSDDIPAKGALNRILMSTRLDCDVLMGAVLTNGVVRPLLKNTEDNEVVVVKFGEVENFLVKCIEISSLFAFMSAVVIRREFWNGVNFPQNLIAHSYTHVLRIFIGISQRDLSLGYLMDPIVDTGAEENEHNIIISKHFSLDYKLLIFISKQIFNANIAAHLVLGKIFKSQYGNIKALCARTGCTDYEWAVMAPVLIDWGYLKFVTKKTSFDSIIFQIYLISKKLKKYL